MKHDILTRLSADAFVSGVIVGLAIASAVALAGVGIWLVLR